VLEKNKTTKMNDFAFLRRVM